MTAPETSFGVFVEKDNEEKKLPMRVTEAELLQLKNLELQARIAHLESLALFSEYEEKVRLIQEYGRAGHVLVDSLLKARNLEPVNYIIDNETGEIRKDPRFDSQ